MVRKYLWALGMSLFVGTTGVLMPPMAQSVAQSVTPIRNLGNVYGITIRGTVRSAVGNHFILDDGTGQVIVDAGPRWFHQINLQPGETVTVVGKYDDYDFDAFRITRANGEVINIRPHGGPPLGRVAGDAGSNDKHVRINHFTT